MTQTTAPLLAEAKRLRTRASRLHTLDYEHFLDRVIAHLESTKPPTLVARLKVGDSVNFKGSGFPDRKVRRISDDERTVQFYGDINDYRASDFELVAPAEQPEQVPLSIGDEVEWVKDPFDSCEIVDMQGSGDACQVKVKGVEQWLPASEFKPLTRLIMEPPHCDQHSETRLDCTECVELLPELTPSQREAMEKVNIKAIIAKSSELPAAVPELVPWESLAELPKDAWYSWGDGYPWVQPIAIDVDLQRIEFPAISHGYFLLEDLCSSECRYTLNPFVGPGEQPEAFPCGKAAKQ